MAMFRKAKLSRISNRAPRQNDDGGALIEVTIGIVIVGIMLPILWSLVGVTTDVINTQTVTQSNLGTQEKLSGWLESAEGVPACPLQPITANLRAPDYTSCVEPQDFRYAFTAFDTDGLPNGDNREIYRQTGLVDNGCHVGLAVDIPTCLAMPTPQGNNGAAGALEPPTPAWCLLTNRLPDSFARAPQTVRANNNQNVGTDITRYQVCLMMDAMKEPPPEDAYPEHTDSLQYLGSENVYDSQPGGNLILRVMQRIDSEAFLPPGEGWLGVTEEEIPRVNVARNIEWVCFTWAAQNDNNGDVGSGHRCPDHRDPVECLRPPIGHRWNDDTRALLPDICTQRDANLPTQLPASSAPNPLPRHEDTTRSETSISTLTITWCVASPIDRREATNNRTSAQWAHCEPQSLQHSFSNL